MKNGTSSYFCSSRQALFDVQVHWLLSVALQPGRPVIRLPLGVMVDTVGSYFTVGRPFVIAGTYQSGWLSPSRSGPEVVTYAAVSSWFAHSRMRAAGAFCTV